MWTTVLKPTWTLCLRRPLGTLWRRTPRSPHRSSDLPLPQGRRASRDYFPATAKALQTMPASMERFRGLVKMFDKNLANYNTLKPVGLAGLIRILMVVGGLVAALGTLRLLKVRRAYYHQRHRLMM